MYSPLSVTGTCPAGDQGPSRRDRPRPGAAGYPAGRRSYAHAGGARDADVDGTAAETAPVRLSRRELLAAADITEDTLGQLEQAGLLAARAGTTTKPR